MGLSAKKLEDAKNHLASAEEIKKGNRAFLMGMKQEVEDGVNQINADKKLSSEGKRENKQEYTADFTGAMMQHIHVRRKQYESELEKAKYIAEKERYKHKPKKPDQQKVDRFDHEYKKLKTELMLTSDPKTAEQKLDDFIGRYSDDYFKQTLQDDFMELSGYVMENANGQDDLQLRRRLSQTFEALEPEGVAEVNAIVTRAEEDLAKESFFLNPAEEVNSSNAPGKQLSDYIGRQNVSYIDRTEAYYEQYPDERPPFKDEELDAQLASDERKAESDRQMANIRAIGAEKGVGKTG